MTVMRRKLRYRFRYKRKKHSASGHKFFAFAVIPALVLSASYIGFCRIEKRIGPIVQQSALSYLNADINTIVNQAIKDIFEKDSVNSKNFVLTERDSDGNILSISADNAAVNKLKSELTVEIQNKIASMNSVFVKIPTGLLFSDTLMTGAGFRIKLKIFAISSATVEFNDEFTSAGINQTKYSLSATVKAPIRIAGVGSNTDTEICAAVPITEMVIVGDIPRAFFDTVK